MQNQQTDQPEPANSNKRRILKRMLIGLVIVVVLGVGIELLALIRLGRSVPAYKNYWKVRTQAELSESPITYVAMGDSAAQGIGASAPYKGYVGLIGDSLHVVYRRPVRQWNISVSGAKVQDVIDVQLPQIEKMQLPSDVVITLDVGSNDMRTYQHDRFASQIDYLFSRLPKRTIVSDIPYFGGGIARSSEPNVLDANKSLEQAARKYGLKVAPLHRITQQNDSLLGYAADFFHPNNKGYKNWYSAFWSTLTLADNQQ
jgi:acyl-CoA thioesterase I